MISRLFWAFLQHISAPSEKEIREKLMKYSVLVLLIGLMTLAPAFANNIPTPEELRQSLQYRHDEQVKFEADGLIMRIIDNIPYTKEKKAVVFYIYAYYSQDAMDYAKQKFSEKGWNLQFESNKDQYDETYIKVTLNEA